MPPPNDPNRIVDPDPPKPPPSTSRPASTSTATKGGFAALVGIAAAALAVPMVQQWEGKRNDPYRDIVGIWTVCYGDTKNVTPRQRQTNEQCMARLDKQLVAHAVPIVGSVDGKTKGCVPGLKNRPNELAASVSLAYNIGTGGWSSREKRWKGGFCGSSAARHFRAGNWVAGCNAFALWNKAGGRVVPGLVNRRKYEIKVCLGKAPR